MTILNISGPSRSCFLTILNISGPSWSCEHCCPGTEQQEGTVTGKPLQSGSLWYWGTGALDWTGLDWGPWGTWALEGTTRHISAGEFWRCWLKISWHCICGTAWHLCIGTDWHFSCGTSTGFSTHFCEGKDPHLVGGLGKNRGVWGPCRKVTPFSFPSYFIMLFSDCFIVSETVSWLSAVWPLEWPISAFFA